MRKDDKLIDYCMWSKTNKSQLGSKSFNIVEYHVG